jgi:hypothetical protein
MGKNEHQKFGLAERFKFGNLEVDEVCELKPRCRSGFYEDRKKGLVAIMKVHRRSVVPGPVARAYIRGEPIPKAWAIKLAPASKVLGPRSSRRS